ncbi:MAG: molybdopterin-guanine dinucleotide biosynthesis protein B [Paracoccaceae bacterium]|nr:molybdopterin-guanine dinucleotide biosynthesis protein B [Paracoccaceae bacterium]
MQVYGVIGWKNSGKTGLMERLIAELRGRGLRVSSIKHAHHSFDIDQPGKDSFRHRQAGAGEVVLASSQRWVLMHENEGGAEPALAELLARLSPVDLVLVEGYKRDAHPKIEAHRVATGQALIGPDDPTVRAVASDRRAGLPGMGWHGTAFDLEDAAGVADFILADLGLSDPGIA